MKRFRRVFAAFFVTLLVVSNGIALAAPSEPYKTRLDNGLTVIIEEEHSAPVVSVQMWVNVGGADESEKEGGISHVFEHMLFKGTEKRKVGEIASVIESVGGNINAYTSFDHTVYHLTVPSRHFPTGLDIVGDAIQHSSFDPDELKKELEVVLEEIRMNEDSPGRKLYKKLLAAAYTTHPYKRPVIGYEPVVRTFTREQIIDFFKRWYIPNNMILVITGDVNKDAALKAVKDEFKGFRKAEDPHKPRPVEPQQAGIRSDIISQPIAETHLGMAFHIPELKNPDTYALDVLSGILGAGESSRLYKKLKIEDAIVDDISAYPMSLKDPGLFLITSRLETKNVEKALSAAYTEVKRLAFEGPNHEEIQKAKLNLESEFIYSRETMDGLANKLGYYESSYGDIDYEKKYIEGIRKVTPQDIKRVINRYFIMDNASVTMIVPRAEEGLVSKEAVNASLKTAVEKAKKDFIEPKDSVERITKVRLDNGITLIVKEVRSNPTVAFYAAFPGGLRFENSRDNGAGNFVASMLTRGTNKLTREELAREVDEMAGGLGGFSGWNSAGASGKFLSMYFDKGLGLFADAIQNPAFPEKEIEKLKKDVAAAIKRQEDYLPGYTFKLLYRSLYQKHPYGMPLLGSVETVNSFTREALIKNYETFFVPDRMVLTIVGDINRDYAIAKVKALFRDFRRTGAPLAAPPKEEHQNSVRATGAVKEKAQINIGIGFLGAKIQDEDRYPLHVMTEVLSGQGGRLFVDLRDRQSLAYSVSAVSKEGQDPGIFGVFIASAPEKKDEAIAGIMDELKKIRTEKVSEEELKRAKSAIIGGYEIGLQEVSSQAGDMANNELYGFGYDFSKAFPGKIDAVTTDDVLRVARKYLTLDAYTISIVGPDVKKAAEKK